MDPPFGALLGYEPGISGDEHPHGDIRIGQAFMSDVVHAFMESPQYRRGILFVTYDIGRTLDWDDPDPEPPEIPDPVAVAGAPCPAPQEGGARQAARHGHGVEWVPRATALADRAGAHGPDLPGT